VWAFDHRLAVCVVGAGGPGYVLASASQLFCSPVVGVSGPEITLDGAPVATGNVWRQDFSVAPYTALDGWVRWMEVNVSGSHFAVKQTAW
jgi:hypothetical protein